MFYRTFYIPLLAICILLSGCHSNLDKLNSPIGPLLQQWPINKTYSFQVVRKVHYLRGEYNSESIFHIPCHIQLIEKNDLDSTVHWTFGLASRTYSKPERYPAILNGTLNLFSDHTLTIKIDNSGNILDILHWDTTLELIRERLDKIKSLSIEEGISPKQAEINRQQLDSHYCNKEKLITNFNFRTSSLLLNLLSHKFDVSKNNTLYKSKRRSPFGGSDIPTICRYKIHSYNKQANLLKINFEQAVDHKKAKKNLPDYYRDFKAQTKLEEITKEHLARVKFDIEEKAEYLINIETGELITLNYTKQQFHTTRKNIVEKANEPILYTTTEFQVKRLDNVDKQKPHG